MKLAEVKQRIKGLDKESAKKTVCALVGHSHITTGCFGYVYCGRCEQQIGDWLGSVYSGKDDVQIGHNCKLCRANYKKMDWRHKFLTPNPFKKKKAAV